MRSVQSVPVIKTFVITRGKRDITDPWKTEEREKDWRDGHKTLLKGVEDGRQIIAWNSGHAVNFDEPGLIVETILGLVREANPGFESISSF